MCNEDMIWAMRIEEEMGSRGGEGRLDESYSEPVMWKNI